MDDTKLKWIYRANCIIIKVISIIMNNFEARCKMCNVFTLPRVVDSNIEGDSGRVGSRVRLRHCTPVDSLVA